MVKISISVHDQNQITTHGYGVATYGIVRSLQELGHTVTLEDPSAQVEFCFSQPYLWKWVNPESYKIGMAAWESTDIPKTWRAGLATCDELWTPSRPMARLFEEQGYPARVYEHGIDPEVWKPRRRKARDKIRFLHMGEPAPRKAGQLTYDIFKDLYGNTDAASLTIKAHHLNTVRGERSAHPFKELNNVTVITEELSEWELVNLVQRHDVLVYPSWGEGFGLIPLQAMATGMPVICTRDWAPYASMLHPKLALSSKLVNSPWDFHTGQMWQPDEDELRQAMIRVSDNYEEHAAWAWKTVPYVVKRYDWNRLTRNAFQHLVDKFD